MSTDFGFKATTNPKYYFVSYNTEDADRVAEICKLLNYEGLPIWYDEGIPHDSHWDGILAERIDNCQEAIFFITKGIFEKGKTRSIEKIYTHTEYEIAREDEKKILIVLLDQINAKEGDVPPSLRFWWQDIKNRQGITAYNDTPNEIKKRILKELRYLERNESIIHYNTYKQVEDKKNPQEDGVLESNKKYETVIDEIIKRRNTGQPILVDTVTTAESELLSDMLKKRGIRHNVLNVNNYEREAEIIAHAGKIGAVTIVTNMTNRGTDILLGGNPDFMARRDMLNKGISENKIEEAAGHTAPNNIEVLLARREYFDLFEKYKTVSDAEREQVIKAGGLYIVSLETISETKPRKQQKTQEGRDSDEQTHPIPRKIGRNEPCPCGSGKVYKKCCGRNA